MTPKRQGAEGCWRAGMRGRRWDMQRLPMIIEPSAIWEGDMVWLRADR